MTGSTQATPARLYCTLLGAALVIIGLIGFLYSASFDTGAQAVRADAEDAFGLLAVNGWANLGHIALGLAALALAGSAPGARAFSLGVGLLFVVVALWGFVDSDGILLGLVEVNGADNVVNLLLGLIGLGAGAATPGPAPRERRRPRPKPASADS